MSEYFQAALVGIVLVASIAVAVAAGAVIETSVRANQISEISETKHSAATVAGPIRQMTG
jgi:hypothetical protein